MTTGRQVPSPRLAGAELNPERVKLLIVHDNRLLREALVMAISAQREIVNVVGCYAGVRDILSANISANLSPDVILLGAQPELSQAALWLHRLFPQAKVLLIGGRMRTVQALLKERGGIIPMRAVIPDGSLRNLVQQIQRIHGRVRPLPAGEAAPSHQRPDAQQPQVPLNRHGLTAREQQVLRLRRSGLSNKEAAARLNIGVQTVKNHVRNVSIKLALTAVAGQRNR